MVALQFAHPTVRSHPHFAFPLLLAAALSLRAAEPDEFGAFEHPEEIFDAGRGGYDAWGAVTICFPPDPPAFGSVDADFLRGSWSNFRNTDAPPELAPFVSEPFYPALSTRLVMHELGRSTWQRLEEYHAAKHQLDSELRAELRRVRDQSPDARREHLADFARQQTPKVAALEKAAEDFRTSLIKLDYRWSDQRTTFLSSSETHPDSAGAIAGVMRAAAFYEGGLLPAQRRLLREIALELPLAGDTVAESVAAQPYVFFSPSLARVRLPDDVPVDVARKIAAYQAQRSALKKELYDVIFRCDGTLFSLVRTARHSVNLHHQAPALDQLEDLAEEIRRDLVRLPVAPAEPPHWKFSAPLLERIGVMIEGQRTLTRDTTATMEAVRKREPSLDLTYFYENSTLRFSVRSRAWFAGKNSDAAKHAKSVSAEIAALAATYRRTLAGLSAERAAIRGQIAGYFGLTEPIEVEAALNAALRQAFEQEADGPYRAYRDAIFEPGLSPEQRRLLFDGAVEQLGLPLPYGEPQPM